MAPVELEALFKASAEGGLINADERDMLSGALNADDRFVREIMTPRTRMVSVAACETVGEALIRAAQSPFSRFPVLGDNGEEVVGIIHLRQLFAAFEKDQTTEVAKVMRPPLIVADVMTVPRLWQTLRDNGRRSAMVINEYGSFTGLVTLEDAIEEVFGEVQDEFDDEEELVVEQDSHLSVRGDVRLSMLADRYGIVLPADRSDTVGGLVWLELGGLPAVGNRVEIAASSATLIVEAMDGQAVRRVRIERAAKDDEV